MVLLVTLQLDGNVGSTFIILNFDYGGTHSFYFLENCFDAFRFLKRSYRCILTGVFKQDG